MKTETSLASNNLRRWQWPVILLIVALTALTLYWPVIYLPNIYDTLMHIRITGGLNWRTVWLPMAAFFYRPMTFAPLLIIKSLFGYYPAWLLNGINIFQHAFNATMLATLAWRLWRNYWRAAMAGLLFVFFPFSYQAVAVYGHNVHPAIVGLFLIGLHTYLNATRVPAKHALGWWTLTFTVFIIGLLTHESGVLFGVFAFLISLPVSLSKIIASRRPPIWLIFLILGAAYVVGYHFLPSSASPPAKLDSVSDFWVRLLYFGQAAAYPFTWFARWFRQWPAPLLVLSGVGLTAGLTAWAARKREHRWPLILGWGWWGGASALLAFSLQTDYVLHGPRLLYLSSVGLALAWAVMLEGLRLSRVGRSISVVTLAFILITNAVFVRARLADYQRLTSPVNFISVEMKNRPSDAGLLLVNLPDWISPVTDQYPVGAEFVAMLGDYLSAGELIDYNLGGQHETQAIGLSDALTPTAYPYGIHSQTPYDQLRWGTDDREWHVFVTDYTAAGPKTIHTGWLTAPAAPSAPLAHFGAYQLLKVEARACEAATTVTLLWQTTAPTSNVMPSLSVFVHVIDANDQVLGQADGPPLGLRPQLVPSVGGRLITDLRTIETGPGSPTRIRLGLYDFGNGQRFAATDAQGAPLADDIFYWPVTPCS